MNKLRDILNPMTTNENIFNKLFRRRSLVEKASDFAKHKHRMHKRKYTGEPYWNHLHEVANLVHHVAKANRHVRAAAYLHDTIEDTDTTKEEIAKHFGHKVANLVWEVTDQHPYVCEKKGNKWCHRITGLPMNRKARKEIDNQHLAKSSNEGATIKLADFVSNSRDIVQNDKNFAKVYLHEKENVLPLLKHGNSKLYKMAQRNFVDEYYKIHAKTLVEILIGEK